MGGLLPINAEICKPVTGSGSVAPYYVAGYVGCTVSGTVPLSLLSPGSVQGFMISSTGGEYKFAMQIPGKASTLGLTPEMLDEFSVAVTFPAEVTSHNGSSTVEGTTVTWTDPEDLLGGEEGLQATSKAASIAAIPNDMRPLAWFVGALALLGIVALVRHRSTPRLPPPS